MKKFLTAVAFAIALPAIAHAETPPSAPAKADCCDKMKAEGKPCCCDDTAHKADAGHMHDMQHDKK